MLSSAFLVVVLVAAAQAKVPTPPPPPSIPSTNFNDFDSLTELAQDYGNFVHRMPSVGFCPPDTYTISKIVIWAKYKNLPITVRGQGLSTRGQAMSSDGGIVIDSSCFNTIRINTTNLAATVGAGATWQDLITTAAMYGLRPYVSPDDVTSTIGGSISLGGGGILSTKRGYVADNVLSMTVITGNGDVVNAAPVGAYSNLFNSLLGGLGQTAIIYQAKIPLEPETNSLTQYSLLYNNVSQFVSDWVTLSLHANFEGASAAIYSNTPKGLYDLAPTVSNLLTTQPSLSTFFNSTLNKHIFVINVIDLDGKFTLPNNTLVLPQLSNVSYLTFSTNLYNAVQNQQTTYPYYYYLPRANLHLLVRLLQQATLGWLVNSVLPLQEDYPELLVKLGARQGAPSTRSPNNAPVMALPIPGVDFFEVNLISYGAVPQPTKSFSAWGVTNFLNQKLTLVWLDLLKVLPSAKVYPKGLLPQDLPSLTWAAQYATQWANFKAAKALYDPSSILGFGSGVAFLLPVLNVTNTTNTTTL